MTKHMRYTLATLCFVASVGCLALWWRNANSGDSFVVAYRLLGSRRLTVESRDDFVVVGWQSLWGYYTPMLPWRAAIRESSRTDPSFTRDMLPSRSRRFGTLWEAVFFPLWYLSLIFALAGVGVLKFRRQFSIRSALVAVSVVAVLLGMAVIL